VTAPGNRRVVQKRDASITDRTTRKRWWLTKCDDHGEQHDNQPRPETTLARPSQRNPGQRPPPERRSVSDKVMLTPIVLPQGPNRASFVTLTS